MLVWCVCVCVCVLSSLLFCPFLFTLSSYIDRSAHHRILQPLAPPAHTALNHCQRIPVHMAKKGRAASAWCRMSFGLLVGQVVPQTIMHVLGVLAVDDDCSNSDEDAQGWHAVGTQPSPWRTEEPSSTSGRASPLQGTGATATRTRSTRAAGQATVNSDDVNKAERTPRCQRGLPTVVLQCRKDGPNLNRNFFRCGKDRGKQCETFIWLRDDAQDHWAPSPVERQATQACRHQRTTKVGSNQFYRRVKCLDCSEVLLREKVTDVKA